MQIRIQVTVNGGMNFISTSILFRALGRVRLVLTHPELILAFCPPANLGNMKLLAILHEIRDVIVIRHDPQSNRFGKLLLVNIHLTYCIAIELGGAYRISRLQNVINPMELRQSLQCRSCLDQVLLRLLELGHVWEGRRVKVSKGGFGNIVLLEI